MENLNITDSAQEYLSELLSKQEEPTNIKIFVSEGNCSFLKNILNYKLTILNSNLISISFLPKIRTSIISKKNI